MFNYCVQGVGETFGLSGDKKAFVSITLDFSVVVCVSRGLIRNLYQLFNTTIAQLFLFFQSVITNLYPQSTDIIINTTKY